LHAYKSTDKHKLFGLILMYLLLVASSTLTPRKWERREGKYQMVANSVHQSFRKHPDPIPLLPAVHKEG
jgi:hypothetical protein